MNPEAPRLTREVLTAAVAKDLGISEEDVNVEELDITGGSAEGENYQCILKMISVAVKVKGQRRILNYVAKFSNMDPMNNARLKEAGVFDTECAMYLDIFPALTRLDPKVGLPKILYGNSEQIVIIMQNLKLEGYHIPDMVKGMDKEHALVALDWVARFHATSYHFLNKYEGGLKEVAKKYKTIFHDDWLCQSNVQMKLLLKAFLRASDGAFKAVIAEHLAQSDPCLVEKVQEFHDRNEQTLNDLHNKMGAFICLIHNDAWTNNFMFKRGPSGKLAVKAIDFQMCRRARPTIDVAYLLFTSTTPELREECEAELLTHYHTVLTNQLVSLGYNKDTYPRDEFDKDFKECSLFGYQISQMHAMMHLCPPGATEAKLDLMRLPEKDEEVKEYFRAFARAQIKLSKTHEPLKQRLIAIARDGHKRGIL